MLSFHCAAVTKVFFLDIKLCSLPRHVVFYKDAPSSLCVHACVCGGGGGYQRFGFEDTWVPALLPYRAAVRSQRTRCCAWAPCAAFITLA